MGQDNKVPRRINRVEGVVGQHMVSRGPGVLEQWGDLFHNLMQRGKLIVIPTTGVNGTTGWTKVENGVTVENQDTNRLSLTIPDQLAVADGRAYIKTYGLGGASAIPARIDWDKELFMQFVIQKQIVEATSPPLCFVQLKEGSLAGALVADGLGIRVGDDGANPHTNDGKLYGISFGSGGSDEAVDLGIALASLRAYTIGIHHKPGEFVEWYSRGVLVGTQSNVNHVPTGGAGADTFIVVSADKAATDPDAVNYFNAAWFVIWQAF